MYLYCIENGCDRIIWGEFLLEHLVHFKSFATATSLDYLLFVLFINYHTTKLYTAIVKVSVLWLFTFTLKEVFAPSIGKLWFNVKLDDVLVGVLTLSSVFCNKKTTSEIKYWYFVTNKTKKQTNSVTSELSRSLTGAFNTWSSSLQSSQRLLSPWVQRRQLSDSRQTVSPCSLSTLRWLN